MTMYDTSIFVERVIPDDILRQVFAAATQSPSESVAVIASSEVDGAADAWGDPSTPTVIRRREIPGEFPLALEVVFQQQGIADEQSVLPILRRVAALLRTPLLSIERDGQVDFLALFPDGTEEVVDEDTSVEAPAIVLTKSGRSVYEAKRSRHKSPVSAAE